MTEHTNTTDVVVSSAPTAADMIKGFSNPGSTVFSSITGDSFDDKKRVISAMSNAVKLNEHYDTPINLVDFVVQAVTVTDEKTGAENEALRTVLIDDEGNAYAAVSDGIVRALQNITGILGMPSTWETALPVVATEERARSGYRYTTLKLA